MNNASVLTWRNDPKRKWIRSAYVAGHDGLVGGLDCLGVVDVKLAEPRAMHSAT